MKRTACFFAKVRDHEVLRRVEFYAQDIRILEDLGFDVHIAIRPAELRPAALYFVWWWTWAFFPLAVAKALRKPILITGVFDDSAFPGRLPVHRQLIRIALAHADANVFVSQMEFHQIPQKYRVNGPRYIPHTVNPGVYQTNGSERENIVFSVAWLEGQNAIRKCVPEIIQAAAIVHRTHPEARFLIAGEKGTSYPMLRQIVERLGASDYVTFLGAIPLEEKIALMQRCKVYLQPSRHEGFGLAILEAMSCGAAVVSSPVGAVPEVAGDTVQMVDGESPEAIAATINRYLEDDALCRTSGERARARAETLFPYSRRKQELEKLISELCPGLGTTGSDFPLGK